ncbi:MAG: AAA family ATPase [Bacteroidetes bacterium]|nr:AAA family ATPase [Bacteroidota bacterium]
MIKKLHIKNFKSIKDLKLDCARVNVFIGEPNTGKSNILEGLGMLTFPFTKRLEDFVRFDTLKDLFHKGYIKKEIKVILDKTEFSMNFSEDNFFARYKKGNRSMFSFKYDYEKRVDEKSSVSLNSLPVRFYKYKPFKDYPNTRLQFLNPPYGDNLFDIMYTEETVRNFASEIFRNYGYRLILRTEIKKLELLIDEKRLVIIPYELAADTLHRVIFYNTIFETNINTSILLEEPEAHVFPFYNKFLAEKIALYNNNQFFIATHNPTFLINLIEKAPDDELCVFITYYDKESYETKVIALQGKEANRLLEYGSSAFMNLNRFYEQE